MFAALSSSTYLSHFHDNHVFSHITNPTLRHVLPSELSFQPRRSHHSKLETIPQDIHHPAPQATTSQNVGSRALYLSRGGYVRRRILNHLRLHHHRPHESKSYAFHSASSGLPVPMPASTLRSSTGSWKLCWRFGCGERCACSYFDNLRDYHHPQLCALEWLRSGCFCNHPRNFHGLG